MEWNRIKVEIGTVDFTAWLAHQEQMARLPDGPEVGRATFSLMDTGTLPTITEWDEVTLYGGGTSATVPIWAGYVTRIKQEPFSYTGGSVLLVTLDCQSAAIKLLTNEPITEQYGGGNNESKTSDRAVVADLVSTYLPEFYEASKIGTADPTNIDYIAFEEESLRSALNKLVQRTERIFGVDAVREFWYRDSTEMSTYSYKLADVITGKSYHEMTVKPFYDRDAVDLRNKVRVVGGSTLSDLIEDSFRGDGSTVLFTLTSRPDVVVLVSVSGVEQSVGIMYVDDPADYDCLVNYDRQYILFDTAPPNEETETVLVWYRTSTRVEVTVENSTSIAAIGTLWAPTIEDASISSGTQGSAVGSAYLASFGAVVEQAQVSTRFSGDEPGTVLPWEPGNKVQVSVAAFGWEDKTIAITAVTMRANGRPGADGQCVIEWDLDLGTPSNVGRTLGGGWNNTNVVPRQHAPLFSSS